MHLHYHWNCFIIKLFFALWDKDVSVNFWFCKALPYTTMNDGSRAIACALLFTKLHLFKWVLTVNNKLIVKHAVLKTSDRCQFQPFNINKCKFLSTIDRGKMLSSCTETSNPDTHIFFKFSTFLKNTSLIMITCVCKHIPKNKHTLWKKDVMLSFFRYALQTVRVYNNRAMQITDRIFFF